MAARARSPSWRRAASAGLVAVFLGVFHLAPAEAAEELIVAVDFGRDIGIEDFIILQEGEQIYLPLAELAAIAGIVGVLAIRGIAVGLHWEPSGKRVVYLVAAVIILLFATYLFRAGVVHDFPAEMRSVANGIWGGTYIVAAGFFCAAAVEAMRLPKWSKPR